MQGRNRKICVNIINVLEPPRLSELVGTSSETRISDTENFILCII